MVETSTRYAMGTLIFLLTGPLFWAAHFTLLYASQSSLCALNIGGTASEHNGLVVGIILVGTAILAGVAMACANWAPQWHKLLAAAALPPDNAIFLVRVMQLLAALSALAMIYAALSALILPSCAQLR